MLVGGVACGDLPQYRAKSGCESVGDDGGRGCAAQIAISEDSESEYLPQRRKDAKVREEIDVISTEGRNLSSKFLASARNDGR